MHGRISRAVSLIALASLSAIATSCTSCTSGGNERSPAPRVAQFADSTAPRVAYTTLRDVDTIGAFTNRDVKESSAAVRSWRTAGVFWTLNDNGNDERVFAFDSTGQDLGSVIVPHARNRDWEALATGPCAAGRCLFIGDVGDNLARHDVVSIYRIPEPAPPGTGRLATGDSASALHFRYPDGPRDVEAMWVDADTAVFLVTKRPLRDAAGYTRPSQVYRLGPELWAANKVSVATLVDSLPNFASGDERTQITDASLSNPFGDPAQASRLAVRTYGMVYVFEVDLTSGRPGRLVGHCALDALDEKQGEGLTWMADGRLLFTSEKRNAPIMVARCP